MPNFTDVTEFVLLRLTSHQELQVLFFCGVSSSLHDHSDREHWYDYFDQPPASELHVLFLESFVFCGCVVLFQCHSEDAGKLTIRQKPFPMWGV